MGPSLNFKRLRWSPKQEADPTRSPLGNLAILPAELRLEIWSYLLLRENTTTPVEHNHTPRTVSSKLQKGSPTKHKYLPFRIHRIPRETHRGRLAIMRTSRAIYTSISTELYNKDICIHIGTSSNDPFRINVAGLPFDYSGLPTNALPFSRFRSVHFSIRVPEFRSNFDLLQFWIFKIVWGRSSRVRQLRFEEFQTHLRQMEAAASSEAASFLFTPPETKRWIKKRWMGQTLEFQCSLAAFQQLTPGSHLRIALSDDSKANKTRIDKGNICAHSGAWKATILAGCVVCSMNKMKIWR